MQDFTQLLLGSIKDAHNDVMKFLAETYHNDEYLDNCIAENPETGKLYMGASIEEAECKPEKKKKHLYRKKLLSLKKWERL